MPNSKLAKVESSSRRAITVDQIRRAIVEGKLRPGDKLTESSLAMDLGVSRPTVREAVSQLVHDGWLTQVPYAGISVTSLTEHDIRDVADLRVTLDLLALRAIYADSTGEKLQAIVEAWGKLERKSNNSDSLIRHDSHIAFHRALWQSSENQLLLKMWPAIEAHMTLSIAKDQAARPDHARIHASHRKLFDAIMSKDLVAAQMALLEHTVDNAEHLAVLVESHGLTNE